MHMHPSLQALAGPCRGEPPTRKGERCALQQMKAIWLRDFHCTSARMRRSSRSSSAPKVIPPKAQATKRSFPCNWSTLQLGNTACT